MSKSAVQSYVETHSDKIDPAFLAWLAALETVAATSPLVARAVVRELRDQRDNLKLIASENYSSLATQLAMGNLLTDKYAEGYPRHRFYAGCENIDDLEELACAEACKLFGCEHAYVQPHSGADANLIAYWAILQTRVERPALQELDTRNPCKLSDADWESVRQKLGNQRLLGMDYYSGGHLTHGYRRNISAMMFDAHTYSVSRETWLLDYDEIERMAREVRPLILLAGYSAYPRAVDFARLRRIADDVGAVLMVDMAHFAGLVAGGVFEGDFSPFPHADVVTTTTHKTLRGPRGGLILCSREFAESVDKGCPLVIGGPLPHVIAAKAVALQEANGPEFKDYSRRIVENAAALAEACIAEGLAVATGGTDNHLMLIDVREFNLTGRQAEDALRDCGITLNRNSLPYDPNGAWFTSGLRVGTPAATSLGMGPTEMREIAAIMKSVLAETSADNEKEGPNAGKPSRSEYSLPEDTVARARARVAALLERFPVYPNIDLALLEQHFAG